MQIRVGPFRADVLISAAPIIAADGQPLYGAFDADNYIIWISPQTPLKRRVNTLLHEVWHSWREHFPAPPNEEVECDYFAFISEAVWLDIEHQGGVEALMNLKPNGAAPSCDIVIDRSAHQSQAMFL